MLILKQLGRVNNLALLYQAQGRYAEAEPLYKRSLAIMEKALGPQHPDVAQSLNNLAGLYNAQARESGELGFYRRATAIHRALTAMNQDREHQMLLKIRIVA